MKYNDYSSELDTDDTRIEAYYDDLTATNLLLLHKNNGNLEIKLSDCFKNAEDILPLPSEIIPALNNKIRQTNQRVVVTGIDSYLTLLDINFRESFNSWLKENLDKNKLNVSYMLNRNYLCMEIFSNNKYEDSLQVVIINDGEEETPESPVIYVIPAKWYSDNMQYINSWEKLLIKLGPFNPKNEHNLILSSFEKAQPGLASTVIQLVKIKDFVKFKYNYDYSVGLDDDILVEIVNKCKNSNINNINSYLIDIFKNENINDVCLSFKRLYDLKNDSLWQAYVWMLIPIIDKNSYLSKVLCGDISPDSFVKNYVCDAAISLLDDKKASLFADERSKAIANLTTQLNAHIIDFISSTKDKPNDIVLKWLNCKTIEESEEIIRRFSLNIDEIYDLSKEHKTLFPLLADYLSTEYEYGYKDIEEYFYNYRRFKVANDVTSEFTEQAGEELMDIIDTRDSKLNVLSKEENTALLIVDGMGAEYYPLLLSMAERLSINIKLSQIVSVNLPSSSKFNKFKWDEKRTLKTIMEIDTISHKGAKENEHCTPYKNLAHSLLEFNNVFAVVQTALNNRFNEVIVTADHGSSRLAVLAYNKNYVKTLNPANSSADYDDWRFTKALKNMDTPEEFKPIFDNNFRENYWVVKGYNRLTKKGGKLSVHGGATLEERLVPFIIFDRSKTQKLVKKQNETQTLEKIQTQQQFIEKDIFLDI
jgi:hypothetical protein